MGAGSGPAGDRVDASRARGLQVGGGNVQNNYYAGRRVVSFPHQVGVSPALAERRQRRPADDALAAAVGAGETAVVCQVVAGLGGVGKTQLAANLADHVRRTGQVDLLMWVTATSRSSVLTAYAQAAADVTGIEDTDPEQGAARLLAWLTGTDRRWLIVLDDLTDPADLHRLWPPATPTGRTVVTTRRRDAALVGGRTLIEVDLFTPAQALAYLEGKLGDTGHRLDEAEQLAGGLGRLPLALAQAAAYILDQGLTCAGYRTRLTRRRLAALRPQLLPDDQTTSVADAWALSVQLADATSGGIATILLQLAALLDPNGIPLTLFATSAVTGHCRQRLDQPVDADDTHDALRCLHRLGLVSIIADPATAAGEGGTVRVHALIQRATREATPDQHHAELATTAAEALLHLWPDTERDAGHAQLLRANTAALHDVAETHLWTAGGAHPVLFRAAGSLGDIGLAGAAVGAFRRLLDDCLRRLGPEHADTLNTRASLAQWRGEAGDPAGAATAFRQLLVDRRRIQGPEHPDTLNTRARIAHWQGMAGDHAGAATAFALLIEQILPVLGAEHRDTLAARAGLATWRGEAGDPAGAASATAGLLNDYLRLLGPDHPDTLTTRAALAYWRGAAGDPAGAAAAYEQLLADQLRVLGPHHPGTLITRHSLALWRGEAGDPAGAANAFQQLLADLHPVLGPDHPRTLRARYQLAFWRVEAGDPAGAANAAEELLADYVRVLGADHPQTRETRVSLAYWQSRAKQR